MTEHKIRSRIEPTARRQFFLLVIALVWPIALLVSVLIAIVIWLWP